MATEARKTQVRDAMRRYREKNPGKGAAYMRAKRAAETPEQRDARLAYNRADGLRRMYGLSVHDFDDLFSKQNGKCAICREDLLLTKMRTHVDHCHATGAVRGLLCRDCNRGLGGFRDSPAILFSAAEYLGARNDHRADTASGS